MNSKRKILIISLFALLVVSIVVAWYLMLQPQVVLALKYDKPLILLGGLLIESTRISTMNLWTSWMSSLVMSLARMGDLSVNYDLLA